MPIGKRKKKAVENPRIIIGREEVKTKKQKERHILIDHVKMRKVIRTLPNLL